MPDVAADRRPTGRPPWPSTPRHRASSLGIGCRPLHSPRAALSRRRSHLKVWDATTGEEVLDPRDDSIEALSVAFNPDNGRWIVTGNSRGDVTVWDATSGKQQHRLPGHRTWVRGLAFSPDGRHLASLDT